MSPPPPSISSSILHTVKVPSFDPNTHQLTLLEHHLISAPLSIAPSFAPHYSLLLQPPPSSPYQPTESLESTSVPGEPTTRRQRKRRRLETAATSLTPADWALARKKEERRSTTDRESDAHHASIVLGIESAVASVRDGWLQPAKGQGWMGEVDDVVEWIEPGEESDSVELDWTGMLRRHLFKEEEEVLPPLHIDKTTTTLPVTDLLRRNVTNHSEESINFDVTCADLLDGPGPTLATLLLPPSSAFQLLEFDKWSSPSSGIAKLGAEHGGWDLVILDPPWPNASATRSSSYDTFDAYDLWKLDLKALLGSSPALVAVWLTNKVKYRRLLVDQLFPAWGLKGRPSEWYWVKIASDEGEPLWDLHSRHRRCYEGLVLGYYNPGNVVTPSLPLEKVFVSTPLGHSRKPVIFDLLEPYLPTRNKPGNVLELFARTALAGPIRNQPEETSSEQDRAPGQQKRGLWMSVGNEAVKFNVVERAGEAGIDVKGAKGWLKEAES